jgi:hypothetical protein
MNCFESFADGVDPGPDMHSRGNKLRRSLGSPPREQRRGRSAPGRKAVSKGSAGDTILQSVMAPGHNHRYKQASNNPVQAERAGREHSLRQSSEGRPVWDAHHTEHNPLVAQQKWQEHLQHAQDLRSQDQHKSQRQDHKPAVKVAVKSTAGRPRQLDQWLAHKDQHAGQKGGLRLLGSAAHRKGYGGGGGQAAVLMAATHPTHPYLVAGMTRRTPQHAPAAVYHLALNHSHNHVYVTV